jgi:hypothetical protein
LWVGPLAILLCAGLAATAQENGPRPPLRELLVPFEDLHVLLGGEPQRVLLSRAEYDALQRKAAKTPETKTPYAAVLLSADYRVTLEPQRAVLTGTLTIDVLTDGLHSVPLDLGGVGLRSAALDGRAAAIGQADRGLLEVFVAGRGRHLLRLEMFAPVETTAARQSLHFRLPRPAATRMELTAPGDVEVRSGAEVIRRVVESAAGWTRFELLPPQGDALLILTRNSHFQRQQPAVVARSVAIAKVTAAYERLDESVSLEILHRAVDQFRFVVPEGFEVTEVSSPLLARWAVVADGPRKVLQMQLRQATTDTVVLNLAATRIPARLESWSLAVFEPLDVVGQVTVVGVMAQPRLKVESLSAAGLIPIDASILGKLRADRVANREQEVPPLESIAAYYAPQAQPRLTARFTRPPARTTLTSSLVLALDEKQQQLQSSLRLVADEERLFGFDVVVGADWQMIDVTGADGKPLEYERFDAAEGRPGTGPLFGAKTPFANRPLAENMDLSPSAGMARLHVTLPKGVAVGDECRVRFRAVRTPPGWLDEWPATTVEFPTFEVVGASQTSAAIAVTVGDDLALRPEKLEQLTPLDEHAKSLFQNRLGHVARPRNDEVTNGFGIATKGPYDLAAAAVAYRCEGPRYQAAFHVERLRPRLTARTISFVRVEPDALVSHYEILYQVSNAHVRQVALLLPDSTPLALEIRGLGDVKLKQFASEPAAHGLRRWNVLLQEARSGTVGVAVDFQQPLADQEPKNLPLPIVRADGVAYQSGLLAVEGSPELDVQVAPTGARGVDVGELADAEYQPGRRLLGAYGFVGDDAQIQAEVKVSVARHPGYPLYGAIVQEAALRTLLSADGLALTDATLALRAKAVVLEIRLPPQSRLWSAYLDGKPVLPQRDQQNVLVDLPAAAGSDVRQLRIVYQTAIKPVGQGGRVELPAAGLWLRADRRAAPLQVPLAHLTWDLELPAGFEVVRSEGTVASDEVGMPPPAPVIVGSLLYDWAAGLSYPRKVTAEWHADLQSMRPASELSGQSSGKPAAPTPAVLPPAPQLRIDTLTPNPAPPPSAGEDPFAPPVEQKFANQEVPPGRRAMLGGFGGTRHSERMNNAAGFGGRGGIAGKGAGAAGSLSFGGNTALADKPAAAPSAGAGLGGWDSRVAGAKSGVDSVATGQTLIFHGGTLIIAGANTYSGETTMNRGAAGGADAISDLTKTIPQEKAGFSKLHGLETLRSPSIDFQSESPLARRVVRFQSLGEEPRLDVTLAPGRRIHALGWALALATFVCGVALAHRSPSRKGRFVFVVALVAMIVPWAWQSASAAQAGNMVFYALCLVVVYYVLAALVRWMGRGMCRLLGRCCKSPATAAVALLLVAASVLAPARASAEPGSDERFIVQIIEPPKPVPVPEDAILRPYDVKSPSGIQQADRLLIPYAKYVELWNLAYPEKKLETAKPPYFALAGAEYRATLEGENYLQFAGRLEIDLFVENYVAIPLALQEGVLTKAELDGHPARLRTVGVAPRSADGNRSVSEEQTPENEAAKSGVAAADAPRPLVLYVSGKGRHTLELEVRLRLERHGGWRAVQGNLPAAPATKVSLTVVAPQTEVWLGRGPDLASYETSHPGERLETVLGRDGGLAVQWRPKLTEGQIDQTLTCRSVATLDVAEDGLRLCCALEMQFLHGQRDAFVAAVPKDYLVEKVQGPNVRGWELRNKAERSAIEVTLLKTARDHEAFTVWLSRRGRVGQGPLAQFEVPQLAIDGAALHSGQVTIRRSPILDVRVLDVQGVVRKDLDAAEPEGNDAGVSPLQNPLGMRGFQSYRFMTTPFTIRLAVAEIPVQTTAQLQSVVRISEYQRNVETRVAIIARDRPLYTIELWVPDDLHIKRLSLPGAHQWAITRVAGRRLLSVYLADGCRGEIPLVIEGTLGASGPISQLDLPRIEVRNAQRQQGDIAVQADPAFDVEPVDLRGCQVVLLEQLLDWLKPEQRANTRLAIAYRQADYGGMLRLSARKATVNCFTITNVRVTGRAIEETILLEFSIEGAGIRELAFLLPASKEEPRIEVPFLRQKTLRRTGGKEGPWQVKLELQEERSGQLRVLVGNDRVLGLQQQSAPIPMIQTGHTDRQFVVLESSGRDEVLVETSDGLDPLGRHQGQWQMLRALLGTEGITQAYLVAPAARNPRLVFRAQDRETVETVGARIGLAETHLVVDAEGGYRGAVRYQMSNATEQFLEVRLPQGAQLWTARVAEEPVKPTRDPRNVDPLLVRIPLVKTASGELPYAVLLKYGGRLPPPGSLAQVEFPLIHTVNIHVELSQARLYLPQSQHWFSFGGTMHPVSDEAGLTAGEIAYDTREKENLRQIMHAGDSFAKLRAAANLNQIIQNPQYSLQDRSSMVQSELTRNESVTRSAQRELQRLETELRKEAVPLVGNLSRMNDLYQQQRSSRARNIVKDMGANFESQADVKYSIAKPIYSNASPYGSPAAQSPATTSQPALAVSNAETLNRYRQRLAQQSQQQRAEPAGELREQLSFAGGKLPAAQDGAALQVKKEADAFSPPPPKMGAGSLTLGGFGGTLISSPLGGTSPSPQPPATGLVSLDVDLPQTGQVYRFTTPRGEVQITAWAISETLRRRLLDVVPMLLTLAGILAGLVLVRVRH